MAKIRPIQQTKALSKVRWEMLKRNETALQAFEDQDFVKSFREWFESHPGIFEEFEEADDMFERLQCSRATRELVALRQAYISASLEASDLGLSEKTTIDLSKQRARERTNADSMAVDPIVRTVLGAS